MPIILTTILSTLGTVALHMLTSLVTETFLKKAVIAILEKVVARTANTTDDQILQAAKEAWNTEK